MTNGTDGGQPWSHRMGCALGTMSHCSFCSFSVLNLSSVTCDTNFVELLQGLNSPMRACTWAPSCATWRLGGPNRVQSQRHLKANGKEHRIQQQRPLQMSRPWGCGDAGSCLCQLMRGAAWNRLGCPMPCSKHGHSRTYARHSDAIRLPVKGFCYHFPTPLRVWLGAAAH